MNLVFDFGAVLFEWQPVQLVRAHFPEQAATAETAQRLAHAIFSHADWLSFDHGSVTLDTLAARTAQRLVLPQTQVLGLLSGIGERLSPIEETVGVLAELEHRRRLRGDVHLYFLSNMPTPYARMIEQRHTFVQWFDGGIFSGDVQCAKPDPSIYQLLQSRYALAPAQTLFVDDLQHNVDTARGLGWSGIRFVSAQQLRASLASLLPQ